MEEGGNQNGWPSSTAVARSYGEHAVLFLKLASEAEKLELDSDPQTRLMLLAEEQEKVHGKAGRLFAKHRGYAGARSVPEVTPHPPSSHGPPFPAPQLGTARPRKDGGGLVDSPGGGCPARSPREQADRYAAPRSRCRGAGEVGDSSGARPCRAEPGRGV